MDDIYYGSRGKFDYLIKGHYKYEKGKYVYCDDLIKDSFIITFPAYFSMDGHFDMENYQSGAYLLVNQMMDNCILYSFYNCQYHIFKFELDMFD